jgi:RimJ/RimL family protein N-acetyltransferase
VLWTRAEFGDVFVRVFPDNAAAIACYLGAGFSIVSTTEQQQFNADQPVDYVWMWAPVPNN